uniref:Uncharacterized protein n=1 Tax=Oryza sativa subsp. japonica TaxID=39947 RepID=Q6ETC0_ORYSJ|nr:hypothetical protein [Oryza sativa Japonica Group]
MRGGRRRGGGRGSGGQCHLELRVNGDEAYAGGGGTTQEDAVAAGGALSSSMSTASRPSPTTTDASAPRRARQRLLVVELHPLERVNAIVHYSKVWKMNAWRPPKSTKSKRTGTREVRKFWSCEKDFPKCSPEVTIFQVRNFLSSFQFKIVSNG